MSNLRRPLSSLPISQHILRALTQVGYETASELQGISAERLAQEINVSLEEAQKVISSQHISLTSTSIPLPTQSVASMVNPIRRYLTNSAPVDELLSGGLPKGYLLEISGIPGSFKERLAVNMTASAIQTGEEVIFVDSQNMTRPTLLDAMLQHQNISLPENYHQMVHCAKIYTLTDMMVFLHKLHRELDARPKVSLLVLNSFSFPFQEMRKLSFPDRNALLIRVKEILTRLSMSRNLTIIITSQLATKMLDADGAPGNFDSGAQAVLSPQLGPSYLPPGRTYRIIIAPQSFDSGEVILVSSPSQRESDSKRTIAYEISSSGYFLDFKSSDT